MDTNTFSQGIKLLDDRFSKGIPLADSIARVYHDLLCDVPNKPFLWAVTKLVRANTRYPTPDNILATYRDYFRENPEKIVSDNVKTECEYCDSMGFYDYEKEVFVDGKLLGTYTFIAKCPSCNNYKFSKHVPAITKKELIRRGYKIVNPKENWIKTPIEKDLKKLADKSTKDVNDFIPDETQRKQELLNQSYEIKEDEIPF